MPTYQITITKIDRSEYAERDYQKIDPGTNKVCTHENYGCGCRKEYHETGKMLVREEKREIYSQTSDEAIPLKRVIDAFNAGASELA